MPATALAYINGFDVYSGDGTINFYTAATNGYQFAFVKATEGVDFVDANFVTNMKNAYLANYPTSPNPAPPAPFYVGPYHFVRADSQDGVAFTTYDNGPFKYNSTNATDKNAWFDATSEADDFINAVKPYYYNTFTGYKPGTATYFLPPVADVERYPDFGDATKNKNFISNWTEVFSQTVYDALGVRPLIYTSESHANSNFTATVAGEHKLWEAWWKGTGTTSPPTQSNTPNWAPWTFWQWSDGADSIAQGDPVPGTSGQLDRDVFSGTAAQLAALKMPTLLAGDYNHNNTVDAGDYVLWRKEKVLSDTLVAQTQIDGERYSTSELAADGNNIGASKYVIDTADYTYWRARYGTTSSGSGSGSGLDSSSGVPEPSSVALLCFSVLFVMLGRSRRCRWAI